MKKLVLNLLIAGIAFGASAFSNVPKTSNNIKNKQITSVCLAQTAVGVYTQEDGTGTCVGTATTKCRYEVILPNSIPDRGEDGFYTYAETQMYLSQGWLTTVTNANTLYIP